MREITLTHLLTRLTATGGSNPMSKITLTGFMLPLFLLFAWPEAGGPKGFQGKGFPDSVPDEVSVKIKTHA